MHTDRRSSRRFRRWRTLSFLQPRRRNIARNWSRAVTANEKAMELATQLYTLGHTDFLNVLTAQRSLYASQEALVQSTAQYRPIW